MSTRKSSLPDWIKQVVATVLLVAGLVGWLAVYYVPAKIDSETKQLSSAVSALQESATNLKGEITNLRSRVEGIAASISGLSGRVSKVEGELEILTQRYDKLTRLQIDKLSAQISAAEQTHAKLQPEVIARLGQDLIELVSSKEKDISQLAWRAANELANYRSILNVSEAPSTEGANQNPPPGSGMAIEWNAAKLPDVKEGMLGVFFIPGVPRVPGSQSALFIRMGDEFKNVSAPALFIVEGTGFNIQLDGFHVRNVIVRNAKVTYKGGPLILENVYFVNCTFDVQQSNPGLRFASTLLTAAAMSFKQSG